VDGERRAARRKTESHFLKRAALQNAENDKPEAKKLEKVLHVLGHRRDEIRYFFEFLREQKMTEKLIAECSRCHNEIDTTKNEMGKSDKCPICKKGLLTVVRGEYDLIDQEVESLFKSLVTLPPDDLQEILTPLTEFFAVANDRSIEFFIDLVEHMRRVQITKDTILQPAAQKRVDDWLFNYHDQEAKRDARLNNDVPF
jgi:hypothetical protein